MDLDINPGRIEEAARTIDSVFLNSPQYADPQLSAALGRHVVVKVVLQEVSKVELKAVSSSVNQSIINVFEMSVCHNILTFFIYKLM